MNKNKLYAFYGSLRPGMYNADRFQRMYGDFEVVKENHEVVGYKMYSLGSYPFVVKTDDKNDKIIVTLVRLTNPQQETNIDMMEKGAGYYYDELDAPISESKTEAFGIYLFEHNSYNSPVVDDGNWVDYFNNRKTNRF